VTVTVPDKTRYIYPNRKQGVKMKQNNKPTTHGGNKKLIALLVLLLTAGTAKGVAEEIIGKIMSASGNLKDWFNYSFYYEYELDTNKDNIVDKTMSVDSKFNGKELYDLLPRYLKEGWKVVYEDKDLKGNTLSAKRLIAIISPPSKEYPNGQYIELSQVFSANTVKYYLPYLWDKAIREGRVK
jgi:hypothetical protein